MWDPPSPWPITISLVTGSVCCTTNTSALALCTILTRRTVNGHKTVVALLGTTWSSPSVCEPSMQAECQSTLAVNYAWHSFAQ